MDQIANEKREHPRYRRRFPVFYVAPKGVESSAFTRDISEGGVFVETVERFDVATRLDVKVYLECDGKVCPIATLAEVARSSSFPPHMKEGMAFRFVGMSDQAREILKAALQELRNAGAQPILVDNKLTTLGQLTTSLAHELNVPLHNLKLIAQSFLRDLEQERHEVLDLPRDGKEIVRLVDKMARIVDQMKRSTK